MPLEKLYLRQINLGGDSKFAKKPYILRFCRRSKRAAPNIIRVVVLFCLSSRAAMRVIRMKKFPITPYFVFALIECAVLKEDWDTRPLVRGLILRGFLRRFGLFSYYVVPVIRFNFRESGIVIRKVRFA